MAAGRLAFAVKRTNVGSTSINFNWGFTCQKIVIQAPTANTDDVYVDFTGGTAVNPGANTSGVSFAMIAGTSLVLDDFRADSLSVIANSGTQTIIVGAFS